MPSNLCRVDLVLFDSGVSAHTLLAESLPPGTDWALLDDQRPPLEQISAHLQGRTPAALHLVSHGRPGALLLGGVELDTAALRAQREAWQAVGEALAPGGDVLLYGCEVAQGEAGRHFVHELARLTGAHVAASARPTGAATLGGDAALEVHTGPVAPAPLLSQADFDRTGVLLATLPNSTTPFAGTWFHTGPLAVTSIAGSVSSTSEIDTYFFAVESSGTHTFTLTPAAGLDVQLRLYDQNGAALTPVRDLFGNGGTETLAFSLTAGQFVYVSVAGFGTTTGSYTFNLQSAAPSITAMSTPGPSYTATGLGQINNAGDIDFFSVTAPSGTTSLSLSLAPTGFNAVMRLYNASGAAVQTINSAGSGGTETLNAFAVTAGSTYYIGVSSDNISDSSGSYTLNADFNPDDPGHPPASVTPGTGTRLRLNPFGDANPAAASIETTSEVDVYAFYANTPGSHTISVADATGWDTLFRVYGADGQPLGPTVDQFGTAGIPATETTTVNLASAGWVYVAIGGYLSETGSYTLSVNGPSASPAVLATPGDTYTGSVNAGISPQGQQDFYTLSAPAGTTQLVLNLAPTGFDSQIDVYSSTGTFLQTINTGGSGAADAGTVNVTGGSTYLVGVSSTTLSGSGNYTLQADFNPDDPGDPPASVVPGTQFYTFRPNVNGDDGLGSAISSRSQSQLVAVRVDNPGSFTFTMQSAANAQLRVYGSTGQALTGIIDTQGSGGTESVTLSLPAGFAYVSAALAGSDTGSYILRVNGPSYASTPITLALPDYTATVQASVSTLQAKFWAVTAPAGATHLTWSASASITGLSGWVSLFGPDGSSLVDRLNNLPRSQANYPIVGGQQYYVQVLNLSDANESLVTFTLDFNPNANSAPTAANTTADATEDTVLNGTLPPATDANSDPITYALGGTVATKGVAVVNANGSYSYTPNLNANGSDSFGYTVSDNKGGSNSYTVTVNIAAVNDAPTAGNATANATEDTLFNGTLPAAADVDGDSVTYTLESDLAGLVFNANGSYAYTPPANFNGQAQFVYTVRDGKGGTNAYNVTINVAAVNDAPVVANALTGQSATVNSAFAFTVPANTFSDVDSPTLSYSATLAGGAALPSWLTFNPTTRTFSGTPAAGNVGTVNVVVTASDGALSASSSFALQTSADDSGDPPANVVPGTGRLLRPDVNGDGRLPQSITSGSDNKLFAVKVDTSGVFTFTTQSAADSMLRVYGSDGLPLTPTINAQSGAANETVSLSLPAGMAYVNVAVVGSGTGSVFLRMDGPTYATQTVSLAQPQSTFNTSLTLLPAQAMFWSFTAPAGATQLTWSGAISGASTFISLYEADGTTEADVQNAGALPVVTPVVAGARYFIGIQNPSLASPADFSFSLDFNPDTNRAPTAANGTANATEDTVLNGTLPAATDADGDTVSYSLGSAATNGTAVVSANGGFSYTPNANFSGSDSFGFSVADGKGGSNSYTVSVVVAAVNDAPVVANALNATNATVNSAFAFTVPANTFSDVDNATLTYSATLAGGSALPSWLSFNPTTRAFSGTPAAGDVGTVNVSVTASDGALSASSSFALVVGALANRAPTAANSTANATEDTVLNGTLPAATDADGDTVSYSLGSAATNGTAVVSANGGFSYTPNANFNGSDSFGFSVADGKGGSNSYTVSVAVAAVNDAPVVANALTGQSAAFNTAFALTVPANTFSDVDSPTLTYSATLAGGAALPAWLSFNPATRAFSGTPAAGDAGTLNVSVTASDGALSVSSGFALAVSALGNRAPVSSNTGVNGTEDTVLNGTLPAATDADGDPVVYALASAAGKGSVVVSPGGGFVYTPNANANGSDSFGFSVADGKGGSTSYTVSVLVAAVNDAPTGSVTVTGNAQVRQLLTADTSNLADADGLGVLSYQWLRGGGAIAGATLSGYVVTDADQNSRLSVRVSWVDRDGTAESMTSALTAAVVQPNSRPTGSVTISGTARIFETLVASHTLADADGLGTISYQWLRDGVAIAGATGTQYVLLPADANTSISVRASYTDAAGQAESATSAPSNAVAGFQPLVGTALGDLLVGSARPDEISGLAGNDSLTGGDGRDLMRGGEGNDLLTGGSGNDTIDGGPGLDIVNYRLDTQAIAVDLLQQRATRPGEEDSLLNVEVFFGSLAGDTFIGTNVAENLRNDTVRGGGGNDTMDGGGGIDTAEYVGNRAGYSVQRTGDRLVVTDLFNPQGGEGVDQLTSFERLVFADKMLAFGSRAEEVARVAFALWTPEIVSSSALFARGISFYDVGYDFNFLCATALQFWPQQGLAFAEMLVNNTRGTTRTVPELMAIMSAAGPGDTGRAAAVAAMALDPAMTQLVALSGVLSSGVVADLAVEGFGTLFGLLPG